MPKLKPNDTEAKRRIVRSCVEANSALYDIPPDKLAAVLGITTRTLQSRLNAPETFTLGELWKLSSILKFTRIQGANIALGEFQSKDAKEIVLM